MSARHCCHAHPSELCNVLQVTQTGTSNDEMLLKHQLQPFSRTAALFNRSKPPPALSATTASARDKINLNSHLRMDQRDPQDRRHNPGRQPHH